MRHVIYVVRPLVLRGLGVLGVLAALLCVAAPAAAQECTGMGVAGVYTGAAIVPGTDDLSLSCDDCSALVVFPFPVRFYGQDYTQAYVTSNGAVQFAEATPWYDNHCLPDSTINTSILALWDDQTTFTPGDGVFTSITGDAPDRVFNIEWRTHHLTAAGTANYEVRFFEGSRNFEIIYGHSDYTTYTVGVQLGRGDLYRYVRCNSAAPFAAGTRFVWSEAADFSYGGTPPARPFPVGTIDTGNHCDDCLTPVTLPFPVTLYGQTFSSANLSSNGNIQFGAGTAAFTNVCLPSPAFGPTLFPHWDDLLTNGPGEGIFTSTGGNEPSRFVTYEWRAKYFGSGSPLHFAVRLFENLDYAEFYYDTLPERAAGATIGSQAGDERYSQLWCNPADAPLSPGSLVTHSLGNIRVLSPNATAVSGTVDIGNHCDDCVTNITLPFPVTLFGTSYNSANVSSNGNIQFETSIASFSNICLPVPTMGPTIFAHWDDLRTDLPGNSITTAVFGTVPNRVLAVNWQASYFSNPALHANFTAVLYEDLPRCDVYLYDVSNGGASATIGVQNADRSIIRQYSCNSTGRVPAWVQFLCLDAPASPPACDPDLNQDGNPDQGDIDYLINVVAGGDNPTGIDPDFNRDGNIDQGDVDSLINVVAGGDCP
ncbi:MAG: hypothetical protein WC718_04715 [Phycisphaerales bacterium]|jgi:hypothetical protein